MRKIRGIQRSLTVILCISLVLQCLPLNALAAENDSGQTVETQTTEQFEESEEAQQEEQAEEIISKEADNEEVSEIADWAETNVEETVGEMEDATESVSETFEEMTEEETTADDETEEQTESETDSHEAILKELNNEISQINSEIVQLDAVNTDGFLDKYGLTYQDLLFRCPEYLDNQYIETYLNKRFQFGAEIWDEASVNEDTAKLMHNLKKGLSYNVKSLLGDVGIINTEYENFQIDMAKSVVKDYLQTDTAASGYYKEVAEALSTIDKVYNVMDKAQIEEFVSKMDKACKHLSKKDIENIIETMQSAKPFLKYAGDASTTFKLCSSIIAMQEIDIGAVELLIETQEPYKTDNELYIGLCLLKEQLEYDPAAYVLANYCVDKVIDTLVKELEKYSAAALFGSGGVTVVAVAEILGKTVAWIYEWKNPSYTEINYATICFLYYKEATSVQHKYQEKFKKQKTALARDEIRYEAACQVRYSCLRVFLLNAKSCTKDKNKKGSLQTFYDTVADMDLYSIYINKCMAEASNALKNGTLELKDVVIRKTDKGQIIDENYDPTESIKAKYAEIQKKYPPDVSKTWKESYGGAIQCFGFARMVFNLLFGCDMPSAYKGSKRYEYVNNTNVTVIGQLSGSDVTADNMKKLVSQGKLGDVTQGYGVPYGQHTMILQEVKETGAVFYQCNYLDEDCLIYTQFHTWEYLANRYGKGDGTSGNGFTLYRANNYGTIYGDGSDMFYDDSVNFVINDGVLVKYNGWQNHVEIPDTVTTIGNNAFKNNTTMMTVDIPDSVTSIGDSAFYGCINLIAVMIPDSVLTIGSSAFQGCSNLSSVQLSNSVTSIGYWAFRDCDKLKRIEIPKSLETTTQYKGLYPESSGIFYDCDCLQTISFEEGTTTIVKYIFANCIGLKQIQIPNTVTNIESYAFYNCSNLTNIIMLSSVTNIDECAFAKCNSLVSVDIPDSVTEIGNRAFLNCKNMTNLKISNHVACIGYWAFRDCDMLESVEIPKSLNKTTLELGIPSYSPSSGIFYGCDRLNTIIFEEGTTKIANCLFANCIGLKTIEIPNTVTNIEEYAFYNCANLKDVKIANSVTNIERCAFEKCENITNLKIPNRVVCVGYWAFRDCKKLESVEIPKSLNKTTLELGIPSYSPSSGVFYGCDSLNTVMFEEGTTKIVNCLFANCTGLETIEIPDTISNIEEYAFYNCANLKIVSIPTGVKTIEEFAFANDSALLSIEIPDTVVAMENYIFRGCTALKNAKLPNIRVSVTEGMFKDCTSLTTIELPKTVTTIGQYAFQNSGLTELTLPENVTAIESSAFDGCTNLAKVNLNTGLNTIGNYAFRNNDALTDIVIPDSVTTIGSYAFQDNDALVSALISDSVTSIGQYIFEHCDSLNNITLGTGLTKIPSYAFNLCPALEKIVLPYRIATVESNAFTNCTKLTEVTIPRGTTSISTSAFSYPDRLTIYGISGTYAETYAKEIGAAFINKEVTATDVILSETALSMITGAKHTLVMRVIPSDFTDEVVWRSSDTSILTVDNMGVITAKAVGTANVRVAVGEKTAVCTVTVVQPVTSISLDRSSLSLRAFEEYTLTATVSPANAADKSIEWITSDEAVATVSQTGTVAPLSRGTATITATAKDGSGRYGSCKVTVTSEGALCTQYSELESAHNYENNTNKIWKYVYSGAKTLDITFDSRTNVDDGFDYIYIYDSSNQQIRKATGTELANETVHVTGDTVKIQLVSDEAVTAWGFKVIMLSADGKEIDPGVETPEKPSTEENPTEEDPAEENPTEEKPSTDESEENIKEGLYVTGLKTMTYTGSAVKQDIKVYYNRHLLKEGTDYTLSYKNNVKAGTASLAIKAKGSLTGTVIKTFKINPREITDSNVIIEDAVYSYDKKPHKKVPVITYNGKALKNGKDFEVTDYGTGDYTAIGTYTVKIKGIGNYTGYFDKAKVIIVDKSKNLSKAKVSKIPVQEYNKGNPVILSETQLKVTLNGIVLKNDTDYIITYVNNRNPGKATAVIKGIGEYAGTNKAAFTIKRTPIALTDSMIINKSNISTVEIQKNGAKPKPKLMSDGNVLVEGKDYTLSYKNNKKAGTGTMIIKGKGNYNNQLKISFTITTKSLTSADIVIRVPDVPYTGKQNKYQSKPVITDSDGGVLTINKDYVIESYHAGTTLLDRKSNLENGTAITVTVKGTGSYNGTATVEYTLKGINFSKAVIKVNAKAYTGSTVTLETSDIISSTIKTGKNKVPLQFGTDYEIVAYRNNIKKGTATVIFKGKGEYSGEKAVKFRIVPTAISN